MFVSYLPVVTPVLLNELSEWVSSEAELHRLGQRLGLERRLVQDHISNYRGRINMAAASVLTSWLVQVDKDEAYITLTHALSEARLGDALAQVWRWNG